MKNMKSQNKVFVLGAGFSAHAGCPLVRGLGKLVLEIVLDDHEGRFFWCERWREEFTEGLNAADIADSPQ
jgi:NAD-dependent SIR2 family protein deacetylase